MNKSLNNMNAPGWIALHWFSLLFFLTSMPPFTAAQVSSSRSNEVNITVKPENHEFKTSKIYAVVIGISEYQDSKLNLAFADEDAQLYYNFLRSPSGGSVPEKNISLLLNQKATRANIIKALNTQFNNAFEEDLVVIYIAAHGMPSRRANRLFFLGSDADWNNLEGTAISHSEFDEAITSTRAQKRIWIADACHSGAAVSSETVISIRDRERGMGEKSAATLVNRLLTNIASKEAGYIILSASSAGETSVESIRWGGGHGVFTYYLVKGLKGAADANQNYVIDIREIYEYVRSKVSEDTHGEQYPLLNGKYTKEFPMSVVIH